MADDDATARRTTKATTGGPAKKPTAKRASTGKASAADKGAAKKAPAKKSPATRARPTESAVYKAPPKKAAAGKAAVKKTPAKRSTGARDAGAVLAPRKKAPPPLRLAAEQTFDDDAWQAPAPEPDRDDPSARMRGILRAAALSLEAKEAGVAPATPPPTAPPPPPGDEPVTRVLVAPPPTEPDVDIDLDHDADGDMDADEIEDRTEQVSVVRLDEEEEADDDEEWAAPDVLDDTSSPAPPPPPPPSAEPAPPTTQVIVPPAPAPAPEKKKGRRGLRLLLVLLVLAAAAGAVFAFMTLRDDGIDYSELKVGDCFDSSQSSEVRSIRVEPCSEPHNSEIFFIVQHPAGPDEPYPGRDALVQFAADACLGQPLTDYLGVPLEQSSLKDFEIVPQESAWKDGKRVLVCGVDTGGGEDLTASVRGSRR